MKCPDCGITYNDSYPECPKCKDESQREVTHDIYIDGVLAFVKGEQVVVEDIVPNSDRPKYQYVVLSEKLQKKFQLSDDDCDKHVPVEPAQFDNETQQLDTVALSTAEPETSVRVVLMGLLATICLLLAIVALFTFVLSLVWWIPSNNENSPKRSSEIQIGEGDDAEYLGYEEGEDQYTMRSASENTSTDSERTTTLIISGLGALVLFPASFGLFIFSNRMDTQQEP